LWRTSSFWRFVTNGY